MLLKTVEADEALSITENKTNSITDIFFLKFCLDLGLLHLSSWKSFSENFYKKFSKNSERLLPDNALGIILLCKRK